MEYALFVVATVSLMAFLGMAWRDAKRAHRAASRLRRYPPIKADALLAKRKRGVSPIIED